jgi:hypothetical protein
MADIRLWKCKKTTEARRHRGNAKEVNSIFIFSAVKCISTTGYGMFKTKIVPHRQILFRI